MKIGRIIRRIAMIFSLIMLITSTVGTTYGYIVTSTDSLVTVFYPPDVNTGAMAVNKIVEHPLGSQYKIPNNISFEFKIELGSYYAGSKLITSAGEMTADASGSLAVSIKPGVTFTIEELDEGTEVKVTEMDTLLNGFTVKGDKVKTVTVGAGGTVSIDFTNVYTPESVKPNNVSVSGIKVLDGRDWKNGDSFTFKLEQLDNAQWTELGSKTVSYDAANPDFDKFDFSDIFTNVSFSAVGDYQFRMTEVVGTLENVDYDKTVKTFTVKVTDVDMDGKLEINTVLGTENVTVSEENGVYTVFATFNNTFVPPILPDPDPITVNISVNKIVTNLGTIKLGPGGFEFVLENSDTGEKLAVTSDDQGKASFDLTFEAIDVGTHTFKLYETDKEMLGMTYDSDVHEITVTLTVNGDNELVAALTMDGVAVSALEAEFQNVYDADQQVSPPTDDYSFMYVGLSLIVISASAFALLFIYDRKRKV